MSEVNNRYMKIIEGLGELLLSRDEKIKFQDYEIENLRNKIKKIEQYIEYYKESV